MTNDETCPQCLNSLTGYASRLVQDSCGHHKCRRCLLEDENGCKTCENVQKHERLSIIEQQLNNTPSPEIKQNTNVIRFYQNEENFQHVSVVKSSSSLNTKVDAEVVREKLKDRIENEVIFEKPKEHVNKNEVTPNKKRNEAKQLDKTENKEKCNECGQEFRRRSHLEWHMRRHTGERPFVCQICEKSYTQKAKLNRHLKLHTDERPFSCDTCCKTFRSKASLLSHTRIHTGEKPYSCQQCTAKFSELSNLNKHLTIHSKEKPFMCADCGARFSLKWRLTVHLRVHSRDRPFSCNQCQRAFNNLKDLRRHEITHSSEKPFICKFCSTHFRRKDNLERHIKNTHYDTANGKMKKDAKLKEKTEEKAAFCLSDKVNDKVNIRTSEPIVDSVIKSGSNYLSTEQSDVKETKSEPKVNAVPVILGPPKLACKKKEFKDKFELGRQDPELDHNVYIYQRILSSITDEPVEENPRHNVDTIINTLNTNSNNIIKHHQRTPLSVPPIHYETSFESGPHATIKNIKFKLPVDYTSKLLNSNQDENESDNRKEYTQLTPVQPVTTPHVDKQNCVRTITKTPVVSDNGIVDNQQMLGKHWRKRTTHIYSPD